MASKKAGRLAGLAALGLAAYMNKDKLFGAKGETKAETKAAETKAETKAFDRDTDTGVDVMPSYGDGNAAMFEKEPGFETKTAPAKVASVSSPAAKVATPSKASSAPVTKMPEGGGRSGGRGGPEAGEEEAYRTKDAKQAELMSSYKPRRPGTKMRDVAFTGDRRKGGQYTNEALSKMGAETRGPTIGNASPVVAPGGDRSTRSDNAKPVFAPGGNRSTRSDNAKPVVAEGGYRGARSFDYENDEPKEMKRGGKVKKMAFGGMASSASKRADGIAQRGKTRGKMC